MKLKVRIILATEDDKARGLTEWAKLFKAKSWEELKMLVKENDVLDQAVSSVSQLTEDKRIMDEIWKREDNELIELTNRHVYERTAAELADAKETIKEQAAEIKEQEAEIKEQAAAISELTAELARLKKLLSERNCSAPSKLK